MAVISVSQARLYASQAGFSGQALNTIVAIAQAESGLNTAIQGRNTDGSIDRGILQINSRWHPEVSDGCAYDPACAFRSGWRISSSGTNFTPWVAYTNGAYLRYLSTSGVGSGGGSSMPTTGRQWHEFPITQGYHDNHYALDFGTPVGTPLYFPESGTVVKAGRQAWGGEVFLDPGEPGGPQQYFFHLDTLNVKAGDKIRAGQIVGVSGGQLSGGNWPNDPSQSEGPHTHFGIFENYTETE